MLHRELHLLVRNSVAAVGGMRALPNRKLSGTISRLANSRINNAVLGMLGIFKVW